MHSPTNASRASIGILLSRYRVRYYFTVIEAQLRRQWQWLLLIYGIGELIIDLHTLADPLLAVSLDPSPAYHSAAAFLLFHAIGIVWARAQREAILGGPLTGYLSTLPISTRARTACNLLLLIIANNVLWVLFVPALLLAPYAAMSGLEKAVLGANLALVAANLLAMQRCVLEHRNVLLPALAVFDILLIANASLSDPWRLTAALVELGIVLALLGYMSPGVQKTWKVVPWRKRRGPVAFIRRLVPVSLLLRVQALLDARTHAGSRILLAIGLTTFASAANAYTDEPQSAAEIWLVANGLIAAALVGLYEILRRAHRNARTFTASLPLSDYQWVVHDVVAIALLSLLILLPPMFALWRADRLLGHDALFVLIAHTGLIVCFRPFLAWVRPHTVAGSLALVITWTGLALHMHAQVSPS